MGTIKGVKKMQNNNVLLKIIGTQTHESGEKDQIETMTEGKLFVRENDYYIMYKETASSGMAGTSTSLKIEIEKQKVTLNRMGTTELKQEFEKGILHTAHYVTPYGTMRLGVLTSKVELDLTDEGGSINLEYELKTEDVNISENQLHIQIEKINGGEPRCQ